MTELLTKQNAYKSDAFVYFRLRTYEDRPLHLFDGLRLRWSSYFTWSICLPHLYALSEVLEVQLNQISCTWKICIMYYILRVQNMYSLLPFYFQAFIAILRLKSDSCLLQLTWWRNLLPDTGRIHQGLLPRWLSSPRVERQLSFLWSVFSFILMWLTLI